MKWKELFHEHKCEIDKNDDLLDEFLPGDSSFYKVIGAIRRSCTISMTNPRARRIFKSTTAIEFEQLRHFKTHINVIHPYSDFRQIWENCMAFVYFLALIIMPFYIAFISNNPDKRYYLGVTVLDFILCVICMADILVNLCTGYVVNATTQGVVLVPWRILVHYGRTYLLFDLLSSFPLDHIVCAFGYRCDVCVALAALRYLKIARLITLGQYIARGCEVAGFSESVEEVVWHLGRNLILVHIFACGHVSIAYAIWLENETWLEEVIQRDTNVGELYVYSVVRATSNFMRLGFGYETPTTFVMKNCSLREVGEGGENVPRPRFVHHTYHVASPGLKARYPEVYILFLAMIGTLAVICCIILLLKRANIYNVCNSKYEEMLKEVDTFARYKQLPSDLHKRIKEYYEFRFELCYFDERELLEDLSTHLKLECLLHSCRHLLQNVGFFNNLPTSLMLRIMVCLHSEIYQVNDVVINAGAEEACMYFITSGTVAVYTASGGEVCHLEDGAHFGEISLVSKTHTRRASVVAIECCELFRLERADFGRAIAPYPDLLARIQRVAEERQEQIAELDAQHRRHEKEKKATVPLTKQTVNVKRSQ